MLLTAYYLAYLGLTPDAVINIDGFNEVALAWVNQAADVDPSMPYVHNVRAPAERVVSPESEAKVDRLIGRHYKWKAEQASTATTWLLFDTYGELKLQKVAGTPVVANREYAVALRAASNEEPIESVVRLAAERWQRGSLWLEQQVRAAGGVYTHVLQPNQYYQTDRRFSDEEREIAFGEGFYAESATIGYPLLVENGRELGEMGIEFLDATRIFDSVEGPIYSDDCCHFNWRGKRLFAEAVSNHIAARLAERERQ
jgi:hypothetical protein